MKTMILLLCTVLTGCSTLKAIEPNGLPIEFTHVSHISQHEPFTEHPTNYGYDALSIGARWEVAPHLNVTIEDGINLSPHYPRERLYGDLKGPREVFTGRISYEVPLK